MLNVFLLVGFKGQHAKFINNFMLIICIALHHLVIDVLFKKIDSLHSLF